MDILAAVEEQESLAAGRGTLNSERADAIDRYLGRPYGDEVDGRSQVVMRDVSDTIEWIKPSLLKIFTSSDEVCKFEPVGPEDEEQAQQETDYVNYIVNQQNNGFVIFHDWFHDALLQKTGYVLVQHETEKITSRETYRGLTDDEMALLAKDADILQHSPSQVMTEMGPVVLHDVVIQTRKSEGRIKLSCIPPEHVLVASDWPNVGFQGCPFLSIVDYVTISNLRQQGYEVDDKINDEGGTESDDDFRQKRSVEADIYSDPSDLGADASTRRVRVRHVWIMFDEDGDGIAELRKLCIVGKTILANEETDLIPVAAITPIRQPHEHYGLSIDDIVQDLQRIRTVLTRGFLDNMYLANNGRNAIDATRVNLDDMLVSRPGGVVRVTGSPSDAIFPLIHPQTGPAIIQAIEYVDTVRESRTGVTRYNQGLDANSLNKTATGITAIQSASQQRIELIARVFAETGVKALMLIVHSMAIRHGSSQDKIKLRNKWVAIDPRAWKTRRDLTVSVGLGTGNKDQMLQHLMLILQAQKEAMPLGLAGPNEIYNALAKLTQNAGFKQPSEFWKEPGPDAQMPQPPNPDAAKAQADVQKTQAQLQADAQKFQAEAQLEMQKMQFEANEKEKDRQMEMAKVQAQEATKIEIARMSEESKQQTTMYTEQMRAKPIEAKVDNSNVQESVERGSAETAEILQSLQQTMAALAEAMSRPKTIIRGPDGRAMGVQ